MGTEENKNEALLHVLGLEATGSTNINDALLQALTLVEDVKKAEKLPANVQPTIVFLTDGEPTVGVTSSSEIKKNINTKNKEISVPIFGLAFGVDPDFALVRDIAVDSGAFARRIYETSDAAIQLEDFHQRISSPLLYDVEFKYVGGSFSEQTSLNVSKTFYKGGEYVIAGKINENYDQEDKENQPKIIIDASQYQPTKYVQEIWPCFLKTESEIEATTNDTSMDENLTIERPSLCIPVQEPKIVRSDAENFIERLWAYLTIQNLLEESNKKEKDTNEFYATPLETTTLTFDEEDNSTSIIPEKEKTAKEKAIEIALKYNFVTDVTSLVVKKPNEKSYNSTSEAKPMIDDIEEQDIDNGNLIASKAQYSTSYVNQNQVNYAYSQKAIIPKKGGWPGGPSLLNRRYQSFSSGGGLRGGVGSNFAMSAPSFALNNAPSPFLRKSRPTTTSFPTLLTTTTYYYGIDYYDPDDDNDAIPDEDDPNHPSNFEYGVVDDIDLDDDNDGILDFVPTETSTTEKPKDPAFLDCQISIYSKTYNRGDSFTLDKENSENDQTLKIEDLSKVGFNNKLVSLYVSGGLNDTTSCCWGIYSEPNYTGEFLHFRFNPLNKGKYESASDMGKLFRAASSIQLLDENCSEPYDS